MNRASRCGWVLLGAAAGCSPKAAPAGGLLLKITTDQTFDVPLTKLHVGIGPVGDAGAYFERDYAIPAQASFPASLGIESNGNAATTVVIDVSVWSASRPLDERRYEVRDVPTSEVREVDVVLSSRCTPYVVDQGQTAGSSCGASRTCDPANGRCESDVYGEADAGESDAGEPDARSAIDGALDAGTTDGALDASSGDASSPCDLDAGPRCNGNTPQQCIQGGWFDESACLGNTQCVQGGCQIVPPSCVGVETWPCDSLAVPGGTFYRSYDGVGFTDASSPATVHAFKLDAYEVTVTRFDAFERAFDLGVGVPEAGAGRHAYLNDGGGVVVGAGDAGPLYETGWDPSWAQGMATTQTDWDTNVDCTPTNYSTLNAPVPDYPINCVTWYEAYAFCIWDGGFLPTEAEWNYAAAGGTKQRRYPWGMQDPGANTNLAIWGCYDSATGVCEAADLNIASVDQELAGAGLWGQLNLAGNLAEWTLDGYESSYPVPCVDCAVGAGTAQRVFRGGSFDQDLQLLWNGSRASGDPAGRSISIGFRCARSP